MLFRELSGMHLFDSGNALRIRAYVSASGVFVESTSYPEMRDGLGSCSFRESRKKAGRTAEAPGGQRESWKPGGSGIVSIPFLSARES